MKKKIAFVGTGMIGSGLAVNAALQGHETVLYDVAPIETVRATVRKVLDMMVEATAVTPKQADDAFKCISYTQDLKKCVTGADFIQECVPERLDLKQSTYRKIQEVVGNTAVIASSSSAMFPSVLSQGALYPDHIILGHPYNPSYLLPLIEICGPQATEEVIQKAVETYKSMGKCPVICRKETEGFIVNSLSWAVMDGAIKKVVDGVCSVEDVDKAIMYGPGMRMAITGQLLTIDLGVDGGFAKLNEKYGIDPNSDKGKGNDMVGGGVIAEIKNRRPDQGTDVPSIIEWRDKMIAGILKLHGMLK